MGDVKSGPVRLSFNPQQGGLLRNIFASVAEYKREGGLLGFEPIEPATKPQEKFGLSTRVTHSVFREERSCPVDLKDSVHLCWREPLG